MVVFEGFFGPFIISLNALWRHPVLQNLHVTLIFLFKITFFSSTSTCGSCESQGHRSTVEIVDWLIHTANKHISPIQLSKQLLKLRCCSTWQNKII